MKLPFYYGMLIVAIGAVYLSFRIRRSKFGLGLRAISQDETRAEVAGIPTGLYKILAFATSGLFVGMAGALWGYYLTFLRPTIFLSILIGAKIVLMTILGGRGTVAGPVVGAILFVVANEFFVSSFGASELNIAATGAAPDPRAAVLPRRHRRHAQAEAAAAQGARLGLSRGAGGLGDVISERQKKAQRQLVMLAGEARVDAKKLVTRQWSALQLTQSSTIFMK